MAKWTDYTTDANPTDTGYRQIPESKQACHIVYFSRLLFRQARKQGVCKIRD